MVTKVFRPISALRASVLLGVFAFVMSSEGTSQRVGDHVTAGYGPSRTGINEGVGDLSVPLVLERTVELDGVEEARSLLVFEDRLLVGEGGEAVRYHLFDAASGEKRWEHELEASEGTFGYLPAYAHDVVLLGGAASGGVRAVRVSTGEELWRDEEVEDTSWRSPIVTVDLALYQDQARFVAARAASGERLWEYAIETPSAPSNLRSSLFGNRVYLTDGEHRVHALDLFSGEPVWVTAPAENVRERFNYIIATERYVFVAGVRTNPSRPWLRALDSRTGEVLWERLGEFGGQAYSHPGILLASGRTYEVRGSSAWGWISSRDADTGELLFEVEEESAPIGPPPVLTPMIQSGQVGNSILYYHRGRMIQARDVFTGSLLWSIPIEGKTVREMSLAGERLYVLFDDHVEVYASSREIFFPHVADGGGHSTTLTLNNLTSLPVFGTVEFFDSEGEPLELEVEGVGAASSVPFEIAPDSSTRIRSLGGAEVRAGWARVRPEEGGSVAGSAIYRFEGEGEEVAEAGVGEARASGRSRVYVERSGRFDTGLAIANPNPRGIFLELSLVNQEGETLQTATVNVPADGHLARFPEEIFSEPIPEEFVGTIVLEAQPFEEQLAFLAVALRTRDGLQSASYPAR